MKKKLICLTLSILMLLSCALTSCSGKKDSEEDDQGAAEDKSAKTITMWIIADDPVVQIKDGETEAQAIARAKEEQEKAQKAVQAQFSAITKAKFKTNVVLRYCSEEEYYAKLESAIAENQAEVELQAEYSKALRVYINAQKKTEAGKDKSREELTKEFHTLPENAKYKHLNPYDPNNNIKDEEDENAEDVYTKNEDGVREILYPEAGENQVDIFYIGNVTDANGNLITGYSKYMQYINDEWLASLNEELSTSSKKLTSYISTSLLNGVEVDGNKYAIPNNVQIGEYTYMLIDKELFEKYKHKIDGISSVTDLSLFFSDIMFENQQNGKTAEDAGYIVPLGASFEDCIKLQSWYWDIDYRDLSVYDTYFDEETGRNYVLRYRYELGEAKDGVPAQTALIDQVVEDKLYKTDSNGNFLDRNGKVLPYTYAVETEFYWTLDENDTPVKVASPNGRTLYLVDGDGNPVTPENDLRVIEDGETEYDEYGNVRPTYRYFINQDADFSILGALYNDPSIFNRGDVALDFSSLFTNAEYRQLYATLWDYQHEGYYGTPAEGQRSAVSFIKGDARILQEYNDVMQKVAEGDRTAEYIYNGRAYHVLVAEYPMATETELYGNMFAVYANSNYLSRAMKVITYLNTNSEMRDLLQYGIEGYHYEKNEDGTIHLLSGDRTYGTYRMTLERTGNCFIATPEESMGTDPWKYAKIQNNASLIHPLLGFDFNTATAESDYNLDVELLDYIKRLNAEATERINECESKEELMMLLEGEDTGFMYIYTDLGADNQEKMRKALSASYDPSDVSTAGGSKIDPSGSSPYTVYYEWMKDYKYLPAGRN